MEATISKGTIGFLKELANNNNREWFEANKPRFKEHQAEFKSFFAELQDLIDTHDKIEKQKIFRIYRDVRFSADKTPYKSQFSGSYTRAGAERRGGYYVHVQPGGSFIATGFWAPEKEDLLRIRKELELDADDFKKAINSRELKEIWGAIEGDAVKTAPKGFDKAHADIELIRMKQFIFVRKFSDAEVLDKGFINEVNDSFKAIRPFFDVMSQILTTDLNGESLI